MEDKEKIDNITAAMMISTAILVDGIQILLTIIFIGPFVNWLISIFAFMTFFLWFMLKGVKFTSNPKRVFTFMGGSLMEVIPGIATLPAWTATIVITLLTIKTEEKVKKILGKQLGKPIGKMVMKKSHENY